MAAPDIPAAKRAGLPVDFERLAAEGDDWLTPEDRYALKTHGVCAQLQPHVFMVRVRIPGGVLPTEQARGLARLARAHGTDWLHVTTRQNVELHWVRDRQVTRLLTELGHLGLSSRSACGHTLRNVMCSEDAGVGWDEPFDCFPDARAVSDAIVVRSAELNCQLPSRVNLAFGGSPRCREDALVNDGGFVSVVHDGAPGYELWGGGSLGKAPRRAVLLDPFVPRVDAVAAAEALVDVFVTHGDLDHPARGRMKYVLETLGADAFRAAWRAAYVEARARPHRPAVEGPVLGEAERAAVLAQRPPGGWSAGVRPQRAVGLAAVTVDVPMGDTNASEVDRLSDLADRHGDGHLTLTRDQNVALRNLPLAAVATVRATIAERGLDFVGEAPRATVRACTGSAVCALGITTAPEAGGAVLTAPIGRRAAGVRIHVSGCPNSCAQHQIGDIGLAGGKVRVAGTTVDGYSIYLGADLDQREVGEVVGRVAAADVPLAVEAITGTFEALRRPGETLGRTTRRVGLDAFAAQVDVALADRWAPGPEPADEPVDEPVAAVP